MLLCVGNRRYETSALRLVAAVGLNWFQRTASEPEAAVGISLWFVSMHPVA